MKLKEAVSWLMGTLQRNLFAGLEECCERPLTEKEQQLTSILSLVAMEPFADRTCPQRFGRKQRERRALGHSSPTVTLNVYAHLMKPTNQEAVCRLENTVFGATGHKMVTKTKKGSRPKTVTP